MSLVPSEDSSAATWRVTTERARPSWVATAAKLPASATRTNTFMAESLSIVANPATLKPILSTISRRRLHLLLDSAIHKEEAAMILVTGANGHLGRAIIDHLAARLEPGTPTLLAVSVRDPAQAEALARRGVEVRHGDFDRPETLAAAFAGVKRLVLVSTDGPKEQRIAQHRNAISAAKAAGVKRIVYTSFLDVTVDSPADFAAVHRASEAELRTSGTELAILRNPLYADYLPMTVGGALESGVFYLSAGGGRASFLSRDELAEAAAAAAIKDRLDKNIYELTGPAVHTYHDVAAASAGVKRLVLVSTDGPKEQRIAQHRNAISAAKAAGVKRIVYTSILDVN